MHLKIFTHRFCTDGHMHHPVAACGEHQEAPTRITFLLESLTFGAQTRHTTRKRARKAVNSAANCFHVIDTAMRSLNGDEVVRLESEMKQWIELVHDPPYIAQLMKICGEMCEGDHGPLTPRLLVTKKDKGGATVITKGSFHAALAAVQACISASESVLTAAVPARAFCAVRPPGHHAGPDGPNERVGGCGFCLLNSAAIAAAYLRHHQQRVAVVDIDVHHGNGTEECLRRLGKGCFYGSIHLLELFPNDPDSDFFPGTGNSEMNGETDDACWVMNCPLEPLWHEPCGSSGGARRGRAGFMKAWEESLLPSLKRFQPDVVILSAGFDGAENDEGNLSFEGMVSGLDLRPCDYASITKSMVLEFPRIVSILEGGYGVFDASSGKFDRTALADCCRAHLKELI